jgi:hypothetical protein
VSESNICFILKTTWGSHYSAFFILKKSIGNSFTAHTNLGLIKADKAIVYILVPKRVPNDSTTKGLYVDHKINMLSLRAFIRKSTSQMERNINSHNSSIKPPWAKYRNYHLRIHSIRTGTGGKNTTVVSFLLVEQLLEQLRLLIFWKMEKTKKALLPPTFTIRHPFSDTHAHIRLSPRHTRVWGTYNGAPALCFCRARIL